MINKEIIASSMLFENLPADQLEALLAIGREKKYRKGEMIFFEDDPGDVFFIVLSGKVKVFKVSAMGKEQILHIFGPGETFGEVPVFHGAPFPASAQALTAVSAMPFPRTAFIRILKENDSIALSMLAILAQKLRRFARQIETLSLKEVPARLAGYLLYLEQEQKNDTVVLDISKGQLASLLGTSPETLSRIFTKMAAEQLITVEGRAITLLNREKLAEL